MISSRDCMLSSRGCMLSSRDCMLSSRDCMLSSRGCMLSSRDCMLSSRDCMLSSRDCMLSSRDSMLSSRKCKIKIHVFRQTLIFRNGKSIQCEHETVIKRKMIIFFHRINLKNSKTVIMFTIQNNIIVLRNKYSYFKDICTPAKCLLNI